MKNRKPRGPSRIAAFLLCLNMIFFLGGCSMEQTFILTDEQKEVLRTSGTPENRLATATLLAAEHKILLAYEQCCRHLSDRYPGVNFSLMGVDNALSPGNAITFIYAWEGDETFAVKVTPPTAQNEPWSAIDSLYGHLKLAELTDLIGQALAAQGLQAVCDLRINGFYGEDYPPEMPLAQTLNPDHTADIFGWIYIREAASLTEHTQPIQKALHDLGLCGGFRLVLLKDPGAEIVPGNGKIPQSLIAEECFLTLPADENEVK